MTVIDKYIELILTWPAHAPTYPGPVPFQTFPSSHSYRLRSPDEVRQVVGAYESKPHACVVTVYTVYETVPGAIATSLSQYRSPCPVPEGMIERLWGEGNETRGHSLPDRPVVDRPVPLPEDIPGFPG